MLAVNKFPAVFIFITRTRRLWRANRGFVNSIFIVLLLGRRISFVIPRFSLHNEKIVISRSLVLLYNITKPGILDKLFDPSRSKPEVERLDSFVSRDFVNVIASNCYLFLNFTGNKYCSVCSLHVITTKCYILLHVVFLGPFCPFLIFCGNSIDGKFSREFFVFGKQFGGFHDQTVSEWRAI